MHGTELAVTELEPGTFALLLSNSLEIPNLTHDDSSMGRGFSVVALLATVAIAVVFLAPMINLMPAPQAKQFSLCALLLATALLFPIITTLIDSHIAFCRTAEIASPASERLEAICIRRC